jgi:hypothetical protein
MAAWKASKAAEAATKGKAALKSKPATKVKATRRKARAISPDVSESSELSEQSGSPSPHRSWHPTAPIAGKKARFAPSESFDDEAALTDMDAASERVHAFGDYDGQGRADTCHVRCCLLR